ncbi:hypothetical protein X975_25428, partial [Stegodyphus mimosarum]
MPARSYKFTHREKADMHLMYGADNGNGRAALRLHQERFPNRRMPKHTIFERLHRSLCENGSFEATSDTRSGSRTARQHRIEESILNIAHESPQTSTRAIPRRLQLSHSTVWRLLNENGLHPYHLQRVQALQETDYPLRVHFCHWFLQQCEAQADFPSDVLFKDEATFSQMAPSIVTTCTCGQLIIHTALVHMYSSVRRSSPVDGRALWESCLNEAPDVAIYIYGQNLEHRFGFPKVRLTGADYDRLLYMYGSQRNVFHCHCAIVKPDFNAVKIMMRGVISSGQWVLKWISVH